MRFAIILMFLTLLAAPAGAARTQCPQRSPNSRGVVETEFAWVRALEHVDAAALSCILDPTFIDSNWRGQSISRKGVLLGLKHRDRSTMTLSQIHVELYGDVAIVRGVNTQESANPKNSGSVRFTDVFIYRGGAWRALAAQETFAEAN